MAATVTMSVSCQADKALTNEDVGLKRVERGCSKQALEEEGYYVVRAEGTGKTADQSQKAAIYNAKQKLMAKLPQTIYGQTDYTESATTTQTGSTSIRSNVTTNATGYIQYIDAYNPIACEETYINKNGGYLTVVVIKIPKDEVTTLSLQDRNATTR
jgi:hypothetical protein